MADEFAFVRTVVRIEAVIRTTGLPARQVPVTLSTDGQPLRQKLVELPAGDHDVTVTFEVTPPRVGRYVYEVSVPVAPGEAVTTNNTRSFVVRVIRDKIRVLQVAGQPSWDVRALRQMLKSNPNVDLISLLHPAHAGRASRSCPNDEMSLIPFPTRELFEQQLPSFDLIILQNFEYLPYGIGDYLENIRSYVEGGGGLAMLGGARRSRRAATTARRSRRRCRSSSTARSTPGPSLDTSKFAPQLTEAGQLHPVTSLRYAADDNLAAWKALPQLEGVNLVAGAKPDATVLAVHPRLKTKAGKPMPVIVAGEYGKGRSLAVTTDTLWRWGFVAAARPGDDGRQYTKLWENAMRWLIQDPDLRNLHVDSDAVEYAPGAAGARRGAPARPRLPAAARTARSRSSSSAAPIRRRARAGRRREAHRRRRRHRGPRARRPRARRVPRRGPARRSAAARSTRATSSSSARAAPSSIARSATRRRSRRSRRRPAASRSARSTSCRRAWRSIRRGSSASTAAPTSSCGAARAC